MLNQVLHHHEGVPAIPEVSCGLRFAAVDTQDWVEMAAVLVCVVMPTGERVCSVSADLVPTVAHLKKHILHEARIPIARQKLVLGYELADDAPLPGDHADDAVMVLTLHKLPPVAEVLISLPSSGRSMTVIGETGAVCAGEVGQVFLARDAGQGRMVLQVADGPHQGLFLGAGSGAPFSKASSLQLQRVPESWTLVPAQHAGDCCGLMLTNRTYAGLSGLYCHETTDADGTSYYHLVQYAGTSCSDKDAVFRIVKASAPQEPAVAMIDSHTVKLLLDH
mmetsp:Transcript_64535/g.154161  ORF Transcript_64535/g.154161 Transcript_64535/m.154161 type:complete len:278 (+) Transcript_64535:95-928(+)|eukprot:CAMPEP_0178442740 /NCGR_PEP_ID=MMETSP0689_2-20121128/38382_1 /TAXON_ID=160604 /ORGANISM="Amphidinium massartii, Strain CS-259" /LENGTH=277 /DNA_ID=CAMNT_0020066419 /DNA_START=20 /DNA_END=853 /DNA_ORIENTATION=-